MSEEEVLEAIQAELHGIRMELAGINGTVKRHDEEIFGDDDKGTTGLRLEMDEIHDLIISVRAAFWTLLVIVGALGLGNIAAIIWVAT